LLRVEAWPFLLVFGVLLWRRRPQDRGLLLTAALVVPALWLVPEWLASGDAFRSGGRALVPNPGQPALASVPALASLREALALPLWPLWAGAVAAAAAVPAARPALLAGLGWIALVAVMAQAGFSGEPRYALPGAALVAIAGALGLSALARGRPAVAVVAAVAVIAAAVPKVAGLPDLRRAQAWSQGLTDDLGPAIAAAGGRGAVLACGPPYVGNLRGPLLAWHLDVEKRMVRFDPVAPGTVFRSRLRSADAPEPSAPSAFRHVATTGRWEVRAAC
jgi:hypothetical protein